MKESLASMQLCTDVDGECLGIYNALFCRVHFASDLADAIATDMNTEDFDLSFTGIGEPHPAIFMLPFVFAQCFLTVWPECRRQ